MQVERLVCWGTYSVTYSSMNAWSRGYPLLVVDLAVYHPFDVVSDRSGQSGTQRIIKTSQLYPPLHMALRHRWSNLTKRQAKDLNPAALFTILGVCTTM